MPLGCPPVGSSVRAPAPAPAPAAIARRAGRGARGSAAAVGARLEVAESAFEVRAEPGAELALEGPQIIDAPLEFLALADQRAHRLAMPSLRVALEALRVRPGIAGYLLRLTAGAAEDLVGLLPGPSQR